MSNSAKTPSTKARKGTVSVRLDSGSIKACFPRTHFAEEKQQKEIEIDDGVLDKTKAYTWKEVQAILDFIKNTPSKRHLYEFFFIYFEITSCDYLMWKLNKYCPSNKTT